MSLNYDPWGRLDTISTGGTTTTLRYAGPNLAGEYNMALSGNARQLRAYVSGEGVDNWLLWTEGDGYTRSTPRWFMQDRQGSVIGVADAAGAVTPYTYGPYGEPQSWAGSRFRYTGQMAIPEAQLYHYRARAYDPAMGRFLQMDPIEYGDGPNVYAFVRGDPLNLIDRLGTMGSTLESEEIVVTGTRPVQPIDFKAIILQNLISIGQVHITLPQVIIVPQTVEVEIDVNGVPVKKFEFRIPWPYVVHQEEAGGADGSAEGSLIPAQPDERDLTKVKPRDANAVAKGLGYEDAHDAKDGLGDSRVDIYGDSNGNYWVWDGQPGSEKTFIGHRSGI